MSLFDEKDTDDIADTLARPGNCNCPCHRKEFIPEKWTIELYKGDANIYRENKDNSISISRIHLLFLVPFALFKNFCRIGNLIFLFISIVMLSDSELTPYYNWIMIFPLVVYSVIYTIKIVYLDFIRRRASHQVNTRRVRKGKKDGGGMDEDIQWKDLKPGDIIYLKKDEIVPADIVVLDTNLPKNRGMICWVDTQSVDGFVSYTMKKAVNATRLDKGSSRKDNYNEYRKILSGKIEYEAPTSDLAKFSGYVKLKKDPRPEHLTIENLVLRGSVIKNTDWVFGLVVYTGHDTKIMLNSSYAKDKRSYFERVSEKFFLFGAFLLVLMSVASMISFLADHNQNPLNNLYPETVSGVKVLYFIVLYSPSLPIAFYVTFDLILLWRRAVLQKRMHKIGKAIASSSKAPAVKVLEPNTLPNLGQVDYCFLDKTGVLTTGDFKVKSIYINSKLYKINVDQIQNKIADFRDKKAKAGQNGATKELTASTQNMLSKEVGYQNKDQLEATNSYQGFELEIADDPEFQSTPGVYNYYKFKENVDVRTKSGHPDYSAVEVSNLPLLGISRAKQGDEMLSPLSPQTDKERLHTQENASEVERSHVENNMTLMNSGKIPMTPTETNGKVFHKILVGEGENNITQKNEDEAQFLVHKQDAFESPDKRVSFNIPETSMKHSALAESKEHQEKEYSENDYMIDYFTLGDKHLAEFIKALSLCHSARSRYLGDEYTYEATSSDELALVKFAKTFGKSFIVSNRPDNPSEYTIKEDGNTMKYKILGVNDFSYSRKRFSIVYRAGQGDDDTTVIYAKGPAYNMKPALALDQQELENYDRIVAMLQERGYKAIAIGRRVMKDEEATDFYKKYQNYKMSLYNQNDDLEMLARGVETGMQLVGIVALEDELRPESRDTIRMLNDANIKLWMVTGDNQENAMNTGYMTGFLNKKIDVLSIKLEKVDDAKALIRNILNTIKKHYTIDTSRLVNYADNSKKLIKTQKSYMISKTVFETSYKFAVAIDGDSLDVIFKDSYLKANFTFICALCHTFIGYRLSPQHKKMVLSMVKKNFQDSPITMAIGDGLNDSLMLRSADISFELRSNKELLPNNSGDIQITSLGLLKEIMLIDGRNISEKIEKTIHFMFYQSLAVGAPIFFFSFFNSFTGMALYDSLLVFLYSFWLAFFPVLVYGGHDLSEPEQILIKFPALYIDGKNKKENIWKNFLIQSLLEGVIHAGIVFLGVAEFMNDTLHSKGHVSDFYMSSYTQYLAIIIITNMKLYWLFKRKKVVSFIMTFFSVASFVVYLFVNHKANFIKEDYLSPMGAIFEWGASLLTLIFACVFSAAMSYMIRHYIIERVYQSLYDWCAEINAGDNIEEITNEMIINKAAKQTDLGKIVKNVYTQTELMDAIVHESRNLLSPADQNANQLSLRTYSLTFLDKRMERQYQMINARKSRRSSQIIYIMTLIVFGGYAFGESFLTSDDVYSFSRLGIFVGFALFSFVLFTDLYRTRYFRVTLFYIFMVYVTKGVLDWTGYEDSVLGAALLPLASQTIFKVSALWLAMLNLVYFVYFEIRILIRYLADSDFREFADTTFLSAYAMISFALLIAGIFIILSLLGHNFEKDLRNEHSANAKLEIQMNKNNEILSLLLPKFIKEKINEIGGGRSLAEDQGEVSLLFCDIMDFDKIINKEGKKVVNLLDYIFRVFDQYCSTHGIQKIETVGKTYMACAGLKSCEIGIARKILAIDPTRRILNLALDMEEVVKRMTYGEGISMRIRIGIHYGRVIAGVIGYHKPQFSLIGDAVNTTSRVCTANNPGQIRMSDEAYVQMMQKGGAGRNEIYFVPKTEEMKGKGLVKIHIVARKAQNTSFKKKVGQALLKNREKGLFATKEKPSTDMARPNNDHLGALQKIKEVLNLKNNAGEDNKGNARNSMQGTPSSSFIKTMKDEGGEFQEYEDDDDKDVILLQPNKYFLTLPAHNKHKAIEFVEDLVGKRRIFKKGCMVSLFVIYLIQTVLLLIVQDRFDHPVVIIILRVIFLVILVLTAAFDQMLAKRGLHKPLVLTAFTLGPLISLLQGSWTSYFTFHRIELLETMLLYLIGTHAYKTSSVLDFVTSLTLSAFIVVIFFITFGISNLLDIQYIFFILVFIWANLMHVFRYFKVNIKFYNSLQIREKRKLDQSGLVSQLLPVHAAEKYFSDPTGKVEVSDEFEDVTLLYADIKGFTDYSASVEAKDVVTMLSALFTRFDKVCHKYALYKVYTIGDCYVVCSFVNAASRDPGKEANNMVKMAMAMIEIIREVRKEIKFDELDMRIGIHTGNIIGGIVGTDIVRYDIWGQDVLIANAMESEGVKGHINVSETTKDLLERTHRGLYRFERHKIVDMEKIGSKIPCYLLYSNQNYED